MAKRSGADSSSRVRKALRSPEATASSRLHKRFSEGLFTIIYPLLIAASSPACLQLRMQFGVRDACFGAEIEALVLTRITQHFNTLSHPPALCKLPGPELAPPPEGILSWV